MGEMYKCRDDVFLHAEKISKIYPGTKALDQVSFDLLKGKVNVLIGENGAGKSTLMKMIAGIEQPNEGKMYIGDQEVYFKNTTEARKHGIGIIHQELSLFPNLNVYQNIYMNKEKTKGKMVLDDKKHMEGAKKVLELSLIHIFWSTMCNEGELLEKFNIQLSPIPMTELTEEVKAAKAEGTKVKELLTYIHENMEVKIKENEVENVAALAVAMESLIDKYGCNAGAVSYTHLDVYKRQA